MEPFLFEKIFGEAKHIDSLKNESGEEDPFYKSNKLMEQEFSDLVDVMRQHKWLPLPRINTLMSLFWRLVGNKISPVAMTTAVPTVSFWCEIRQGRSIALILVPQNWHDMLVADPHYQMGALAFAASQSKDYWNHKFRPGTSQEVKHRAWSYEAELLHYFSKTVPHFKPNEYQQKIMSEYPAGIDSVASHYEGRGYDGVFPPFPVAT